MDHSKRKNIYIIVFVVTTIIAACVAVYFGIKENERKGDLQIANKDIEEYKAKLEQATVNKGEVTTPSTDKKDCEEKVVTKSTPVGFNKDKCLNKSEGTTFEENYGDGSTIQSLHISNGNVVVNFTEDAKSQFPNMKVSTKTDLTIKGFSSKVVDMYVGMTGQAIEGMVILFLMEDGTVEYMPLRKALDSGTMKTYGKISTVSDIVKFVKGGGMYSQDGVTVGGLDVFAINSKGEFYSIAGLLKDSI